METRKEGGRTTKIPARVINGVGLGFMNLTLLVTWTIDHVQCHPGNQQLGHTLYKWSRACVPRSSIWIMGSSQRKEQNTAEGFFFFLSIISPSSPFSFFTALSLSSFFSQGLRSHNTSSSENESLCPPTSGYFQIVLRGSYFSMVGAHI